MTTKHLVVFQHGMWGSPKNLHFVVDSFQKEVDQHDLILFNCPANAGYKTYDGIDKCAERLADEIVRILDSEEGAVIDRLSLIGYSLGGLMVRFAAAILFSRGIFERVKPMNLVTIATPHLGARKPEAGLYQWLFNRLMPVIISRTGDQLALTDVYDEETKKPLLLAMSDPDSIFSEALVQFQRRVAYANVLNDRTVAYTTASFSVSNPYRRKPAVVVDPKYPSIVQVGHEGTYTPPKIATVSVFRTVLLVTLFPVVMVLFAGMSAFGLWHRSKDSKIERKALRGGGGGGGKTTRSNSGKNKRSYNNGDSSSLSDPLLQNSHENNNTTTAAAAAATTTTTEAGETQIEENEIDSPTARLDKEIEEGDTAMEMTLDEEQKEILEHIPPNIVELRKKIAENLADQGWEKVDVKTKHWHAHSAIVARTRYTSGSEDVAQHIVDHFAMRA